MFSQLVTVIHGVNFMDGVNFLPIFPSPPRNIIVHHSEQPRVPARQPSSTQSDNVFVYYLRETTCDTGTFRLLKGITEICFTVFPFTDMMCTCCARYMT